MRIAVTGGRNFTDRNLVARTLDRLRSEQSLTCLIHGGCRGADLLAAAWAKCHDIPTLEFLPAWNKFGPKAGPLRNTQMSIELMSCPAGLSRFQREGGMAVAFPGGRGTADMKKQAAMRGIQILEVIR